MATIKFASSKATAIDVTSFLAGKTGSALSSAFATLSDFESKVEAAKSVATSLTVGDNTYTVAKGLTNSKVDFVYNNISFTTKAGLETYVTQKAALDAQIAVALTAATTLTAEKTALTAEKTVLTAEKTALTAQLATINNTTFATEQDAFNAGKLAGIAESAAAQAATGAVFALTDKPDTFAPNSATATTKQR